MSFLGMPCYFVDPFDLLQIIILIDSYYLSMNLALKSLTSHRAVAPQHQVFEHGLHICVPIGVTKAIYTIRSRVRDSTLLLAQESCLALIN